MRHIVPCRQPPPGPDNVSLTRVLIRLFQTTKRACIYGLWNEASKHGKAPTWKERRQLVRYWLLSRLAGC